MFCFCFRGAVGAPRFFGASFAFRYFFYSCQRAFRLSFCIKISNKGRIFAGSLNFAHWYRVSVGMYKTPRGGHPVRVRNRFVPFHGALVDKHKTPIRWDTVEGAPVEKKLEPTYTLLLVQSPPQAEIF